MDEKTIHFEDFHMRTTMPKEAVDAMIRGIEEAVEKEGMDKELLRGATLSVSPWVGYLGEAFAFHLRQTFACTGPVEEERNFYVPATWWQHFKQDHMPEWFKRRFPVEMMTLNVRYTKFAKICPHRHRHDFPPSDDPCVRFLCDMGPDLRIVPAAGKKEDRDASTAPTAE